MLPQQHHADLVLIDVEGDPVHAAGEGEHLLETDARQPGDLRHARGNALNDAHLPQVELRYERLARRAHSGEGAVQRLLERVGGHACRRHAAAVVSGGTVASSKSSTPCWSVSR